MRELTPDEIEQRQFVDDAMQCYYRAAYRRDARRRFWGRLAYAAVIMIVGALMLMILFPRLFQP